jgi:hypothetical protein
MAGLFVPVRPTLKRDCAGESLFLWENQMSNLLFDEYPLIIIPSLAQRIGLGEAIIVQQIHYWVQRKQRDNDGFHWVYNTMKEWQKQFPFWSENTIAAYLKNLRDSKIVIAEMKSKNTFDKTLYYRIDYEILGASIPQKLGNRKTKNCGLSNTETTRDYFEEFFTVYPKKAGKAQAMKAWKDIELDDDLFAKIIKAIKDQELEKREVKFIPDPSTWLNGKRWEDDLTNGKSNNGLKYWQKGYQP